MVNNKKIEPGIVQLASGLYRVRIKDMRGARYPQKSFKRLTDARSYKQELRTLRDQSTEATPMNVRKMSFGDYWIEWSKTCRKKVSSGWQQSQNAMAKNYLIPLIGHFPIRQVSARTIADVLAKVEQHGLGAQSQLHIYNLLHKMFDDAVHFFEWLDRNPVTWI